MSSKVIPSTWSPSIAKHCSRPPQRDHRMCLIAKELGCLHRLTHAAGHGHSSSASASGRKCSLLGLLPSSSPTPGFTKLAISFSPKRLSSACVPTRFSRSVGRLQSTVVPENNSICCHYLRVHHHGSGHGMSRWALVNREHVPAKSLAVDWRQADEKDVQEAAHELVRHKRRRRSWAAS